MSEVSVCQSYFDKRWPLLGSKSSLVTIGIAEVIVGFFLLGNLNETAASKQNLGYSFNTLLTSAGVIVSFIGVVNFAAVCPPPSDMWIGQGLWSDIVIRVWRLLNPHYRTYGPVPPSHESP